MFTPMVLWFHIRIQRQMKLVIKMTINIRSAKSIFLRHFILIFTKLRMKRVLTLKFPTFVLITLFLMNER